MGKMKDVVEDIVANPVRSKTPDENWSEITLWFKFPLVWHGFFDDCVPEVKSMSDPQIVGDCLRVTCTVNDSYMKKAAESNDNRLIMTMGVGRPKCGGGK